MTNQKKPRNKHRLLDLEILVAAVSRQYHGQPEMGLSPNKGEQAAFNRLVRAGLLIDMAKGHFGQGYLATRAGEYAVTGFVTMLNRWGRQG